MKHFLVIPLAGQGSRFLREGYDTPKQMLPVGESTTFEHSIRSIELDDFEVIFIMRNEQVKLGLMDFIKSRIGNNAKFIVIDKQTRGSVETVLESESLIPPDANLTIFTMDVAFSEKYTAETFENSWGGGVLTFKSNSPNYSYAKVKANEVIETAEKIPISENALVGIYFFSTASAFFRYAKEMLSQEDVSGGEFYVAPLYNYLIRDGIKVSSKSVNTFYVFGTPDEYRFFNETIARSLNIRRVGVCSDHSGIDTKNLVKEIIRGKGFEVIDYGTHSHKDCDYNDFVEKSINALKGGEVDLVFASCRSGQGVAIAGGAYEGIIPTVIYSAESAEFAIKHNCSNFISLPSNLFDNYQSISEIINRIFESKFEGGRHQLRLMKVANAKLRR
jgi:RpiB/LacA/LacB family sugar-phosphate isomerase